MAAMIPEIVKLLLSKEAQDSAALVLRALKTSKKQEWRTDLVILEEKFKYNEESECSVLISFAMKVLAGKGWEETQTEMARFTATELVRNSFVHGFRNSRRGKVSIRILVSTDLFEINIKSPGPGFDLLYELACQRADDPHSRPAHALGIIYRNVTALSQDDNRNSVRALLARDHKAPTGEEVEDLLVLEFKGDLDHLLRSGYHSSEAVDKIRKSRALSILVDLSEVTYLGSLAVDLVIGLVMAARKRKRLLAFCCSRQRVWDFFQITRLAGAVPTFRTREEATAYLRIAQKAKRKKEQGM